MAGKFGQPTPQAGCKIGGITTKRRMRTQPSRSALLTKYLNLTKDILPHIIEPSLQMERKFQNIGLNVPLTKNQLLQLSFMCLTRLDPGEITFKYNNFNVQKKMEHLTEILLMYSVKHNKSTCTTMLFM